MILMEGFVICKHLCRYLLFVELWVSYASSVGSASQIVAWRLLGLLRQVGCFGNLTNIHLCTPYVFTHHICTMHFGKLLSMSEYGRSASTSRSVWVGSGLSR